MKKNIRDSGFDKKRYAQLVIAAKGADRTAQQFAADIGVPPSTLSRIINMKNATASADRILLAIAENAADGSGVTIDQLREANGLVDRGTAFGQWESKYEECTRIIIKEMEQLGCNPTDMDITRGSDPDASSKMEIAVGAGVRYKGELQIITPEYGRWMFAYKGAPGPAGSGIFHRWILMMLFALQNDEIDKASIVFLNRTLFVQMKRLLDDVKTSKCISTILMDMSNGMIKEEYCTGRKYGLWNKSANELITLCDILRERYVKQNGQPENDDLSCEEVRLYCTDGKRELTDIFIRLGLEDELDLLKEKEGKNSCYLFYQSEVPFINELLDGGSKKLADLTVGLHLNMYDGDALHLYHRIRGMFEKRCATLEEAEERTRKTYHILDIPMHEKSIAIVKMYADFDRTMAKSFVERRCCIMSRQDDVEWLSYLEKDMRRNLDKYLNLYDRMYEIRKSELGATAGEVCVEDYSGTGFMDSVELLEKALEENEE